MTLLSVYIVISHDSEIQLVVLNFMPIHKTDLVRSCRSLSSCNIQLIFLTFSVLIKTGDLFREEVRQKKLANPTKKPIP